MSLGTEALVQTVLKGGKRRGRERRRAIGAVLVDPEEDDEEA